MEEPTFECRYIDCKVYKFFKIEPLGPQRRAKRREPIIINYIYILWIVLAWPFTSIILVFIMSLQDRDYRWRNWGSQKGICSGLYSWDSNPGLPISHNKPLPTTHLLASQLSSAGVMSLIISKGSIIKILKNHAKKDIRKTEYFWMDFF